jgi:hypothetical protein
MEGIETPHMDKYKEIKNDWNYDASCMLTSLLLWDLENFKCLDFIAQSVQEDIKKKKMEINQRGKTAGRQK